MEEMSPAVGVALGLGNCMCENPGIPNHIEITRLKLITETATLLSDPILMLDDNSSYSWDSGHDRVNPECNEAASLIFAGSKDNVDKIKMKQIADNMPLVNDVQESEEDDILSVREDINVPLYDASDITVPLYAASETSLPIAVEIEGIENGQIVAKVISVEESSVGPRLSNDVLTISAKPNEEYSAGPTIKESVVSFQLSSEKDSTKGAVKTVFELDCVPLWGSVSICGHRPEMEDAITAAPHFTKIPIKMFTGDVGLDGISQTLGQLTSHFFGVYDGHGGSQVCMTSLSLHLFSNRD